MASFPRIRALYWQRECSFPCFSRSTIRIWLGQRIQNGKISTAGSPLDGAHGLMVLGSTPRYGEVAHRSTVLDQVPFSGEHLLADDYFASREAARGSIRSILLSDIALKQRIKIRRSSRRRYSEAQRFGGTSVNSSSDRTKVLPGVRDGVSSLRYKPVV